MPRSNTKPEPTAIIVITVDCLRADHVGCYGYSLPTTPFIDCIADKGTLFEYAFSPIALTTPSHASLLTGKHPRFHSVGFSNGSKVLNKEQEVTLPLILRGLGYKTAAFVSILALHRQFGLDLGFDTYDDSLPQSEMNRPEVLRRNANLTTSAALHWINENKANPFFIWIHYVDPHAPYTTPPPYDNLFVGDPSYGPPLTLGIVPLNNEGGIPDYAVLKPVYDSDGNLLDYERNATFYMSQYDGNVRLVDDQLQILSEKLRELNLYDNSMIAITADHGEAMGENNMFFNHAPTVSLDQVHIPLIMKMPSYYKIKPGKLTMPVSTLDIMPTILALCDSDAGYLGLQGLNLLPLLSDKNTTLPERYIFSEIPSQISIIDRRFQLLYGKTEAEAQQHSFPYLSSVAGVKLFDYRSDPFGSKDLATENPDIVERLKTIAEHYLNMPNPNYSVVGSELSEQEKESLKQRLKQLGYISSEHLRSEALSKQLQSSQQELINERVQSEALSKQLQSSQQELINERVQSEALSKQLQSSQQELINERVQSEALSKQLQSSQQELINERVQSEALSKQLQSSRRKLLKTVSEKDSIASSLRSSERELLNAKTQLSSLSQQLQLTLTSYSWRITAPLRTISLTIINMIRRVCLLLKEPIFEILARCAWLRHLLYTTLNILKRFRRVQRLGAWLLNPFPGARNNILLLIRADRKTADSIVLVQCKKYITPIRRYSHKKIEAIQKYYQRIGTMLEQEATDAYKKRIIYYWINDISTCATNTGVQRVSRCLANELIKLKNEIVFVRWDEEENTVVLATQSDLKMFSLWNGPKFSKKDLSHYPTSNNKPIALHEVIHTDLLNHTWLIIPEVTHALDNTPLTLAAIEYAHRYGMKTAFIFYDAIPLKLELYSLRRKEHSFYMKDLTRADLVIPISVFSAKDLEDFYLSEMKLDEIDLPVIKPILLPAECAHISRNAKRSSTGKELVILSIGTIEPRKNHNILIAAFQNLCDRFPNAQLKLLLSGNLHYLCAPIISEATHKNPKIKYLGYLSDKNIAKLYSQCRFSVFPSIEEGFGLPIAESLWHGKPAICANFGSMYEVAKDGGCLTIDVRSVEEMENALERLLFDGSLYNRLLEQACSRDLKSWQSYANQILDIFDNYADRAKIANKRIDKIYYWVDHTCTYPVNSGIQRVTRGLAKTLQESAIPIIPVSWNTISNTFYSPSKEELLHLSKWNGPDASEFLPLQMPNNESNAWLLIPELTTYGPDLKKVAHAAKSIGLKTAIIFFDALPYTLSKFYPPEATQAHINYMQNLIHFDYVFPISNFSRSELKRFLKRYKDVVINSENTVESVQLPGEFFEHERVTFFEEPSSPTIRILCVGTIEPRKNHLVLLKAFDQVSRQLGGNIELILVGNCSFPDLGEKVNTYINKNNQIKWLENTDDAALAKEYAKCHFTVYPSLSEGFGLPILESLWHGKPCICRDAGAMVEAAEGGGCLTVDTSNVNELAKAILSLATDREARAKLGKEAVTRHIKSWPEYSAEITHYLSQATTDTHSTMSKIEPSLELISDTKFTTKTNPLLSICITTYNRSDWLSLNINILRKWTHRYGDMIEIVVCDNASTDNTPEIVQPFLKDNNFFYYRNLQNVGMLGNLKVTAQHARGQYIWIIGDDDIIKEEAIAKVLSAIQEYPEVSLIYLNYAYTRIVDALEIEDIQHFLQESTPIVSPTPDEYAKIKDIATNSENFFTAIYCLIFRRDHALKAYAQNTWGRPFSTLLSCIPTAYYVCNHMFEEMGVWIGEPCLVVNMNVSWLKYASLWVLERIPELHELSQQKGANPKAIDRWRAHNCKGIIHYLNEIYFNDTEYNLAYFSIDRLIQRYKHIKIFQKQIKQIIEIYSRAYKTGMIKNVISPEALAKRYNLHV